MKKYIKGFFSIISILLFAGMAISSWVLEDRDKEYPHEWCNEKYSDFYIPYLDLNINEKYTRIPISEAQVHVSVIFYSGIERYNDRDNPYCSKIMESKEKTTLTSDFNGFVSATFEPVTFEKPIDQLFIDIYVIAENYESRSVIYPRDHYDLKRVDDTIFLTPTDLLLEGE